MATRRKWAKKCRTTRGRRRISWRWARPLITFRTMDPCMRCKWATAAKLLQRKCRRHRITYHQIIIIITAIKDNKETWTIREDKTASSSIINDSKWSLVTLIINKKVGNKRELVIFKIASKLCSKMVEAGTQNNNINSYINNNINNTGHHLNTMRRSSHSISNILEVQREKISIPNNSMIDSTEDRVVRHLRHSLPMMTIAT